MPTSVRLAAWVALWSMLAPGVLAQDTGSEPWAWVGLRAGPTIGFVSGSFVEDGGVGASGVELKLTASKRVFSVVEFVTGFGMTQKGAQGVEVVDSDSLLSYKFGYLQFPLTLRPRFRIGESSWYVAPLAGIYFGLGQGCDLKEAELYAFDTPCSTSTPGGEIESLDIGVPVGVGAFIEFVGGSRLEFEVRADIGLTNLLQSAKEAGLSATNHVLVVEFGFSYPL